MQDMKPEDLASDDYQEASFTYFDGYSVKYFIPRLKLNFPMAA